MKNLEKRAIYFIALISTIFFILLGIESIQAQDIIIKNDKTEIQAKVLEIAEYVIKYKQFNHLDGPVRTLNKSQIFMIIYENGARETFDTHVQRPKPSQQQAQPQPSQQQQFQESSQESKPKKEFSHQGFCFGGKAGFYIPSERFISEYYGPSFMGGLLLGYWWENGWGAEIDWRYYSREGLTLSPLTLTTYYNVYKAGNLETYVGLGLGACFINESIDEISLTAFEFHSTGGIRFAPFYVELSFLTIPLIKDDINLGGFLISGGIFF